jgi:hypothetical protein
MFALLLGRRRRRRQHGIALAGNRARRRRACHCHVPQACGPLGQDSFPGRRCRAARGIVTFVNCRQSGRLEANPAEAGADQRHFQSMLFSQCRKLGQAWLGRLAGQDPALPWPGGYVVAAGAKLAQWQIAIFSLCLHKLILTSA